MKKGILVNFKNKLINGPVYGLFSKTSDPSVIEAVGISGFDFVILDMEHGPNDFKNIENLVRAAENFSLVPIIRVAENSPTLIGKALDTGAVGVQIPNISNREDALAAVEAARFYPLGKRGVCRFVRNANYGSISVNQYFKSSNECIVCIQIEGKEGIDSIDQILEVDGIDIVFIGPYDLSQSLGIPGDIQNKLIWQSIKIIAEKAKKKKKSLGIFIDDISKKEDAIKNGINYIAYSVDIEIMRDSCEKIVKKLLK